MDFSLFYFANNDEAEDRYKLLLEGAKFADQRGFTAVWTPERHFHAFGGLYPNPSVTSAAVAAVTERVQVRAGSVVAPLHPPLRIAEEWSVVDNISRGRAGIAFASGWHASDFVLRPQAYETRKTALVDMIEQVRSLWRLDPVTLPNGVGEPSEVRIHPAPVRPELPVWLTSAGSPATFQLAGERGYGVLTHLLGQEIDVLTKRIEEYRTTFRAHNGPDAGDGHVALMVHTFVGDDRDEVREIVREPFSRYLASSFDLLIRAAEAAGTAGAITTRELRDMAPTDIDFLVKQAFDRYFDLSGMFGTVEDCLDTARDLADAGVDEVACLIDFGVPHDTVLDSLDLLGELHDSWRSFDALR
ncbi:LLM class flavin-dependent oxidoreductase [Actinoplanes sp. LDG1-06]|uniref:LLM class flavin-dependent oxidoreductase n=1 Tax=Paractinoplanes ovalisporus TaxID=2810368 RepID=A0ABS2AI55_9ACTN|nr:MupA/Atu3671 family FMN-dependent luciferase-like monooxygenase [Actinoplanes ovalisporus]MBM2619516.1 LLM class flavin-dependent oxidoreductase [Actinoplanes ovalisporus]